MKELLEALGRLVPFLQQYPAWVRALFCLLLLLGALFFAALLFAKRSSPTTAGGTAEALQPVGDREIDAAQTKLTALGDEANDAEIIAALRHLFYRNLYRHIREEEPETALFAFCRTEYLLSLYQPRLRSSSARDAIGYARTRLVKLQQHVGTLYGPHFSPQLHCQHYGEARSTFIGKLPPRIGDPLDQAYVQAANATLAELREALHGQGIYG
jgi:hypothetical protein